MIIFLKTYVHHEVFTGWVQLAVFFGSFFFDSDIFRLAKPYFSSPLSAGFSLR